MVHVGDGWSEARPNGSAPCNKRFPQPDPSASPCILTLWHIRWARRDVPVSADHNASKEVARKFGAPRIHLRCCSARTSAPSPGCEPCPRSAQTSNLSAETPPGPRAKRPPHPLPWIRTMSPRFARFEFGSYWTQPRPRSWYLTTAPPLGCGSVQHRCCSPSGPSHAG